MNAARPPASKRARAASRGAVAVEFALVSSVLCTLLIGTLEFGRLNWYWVTAVEMTRLGARMAIVCDQNDSNIKQRMVDRLPLLTASDITVSYTPAGCTVANCLYATVSIAPTTFPTFIPFVPLSLTMPPFTTTLPRESMQSTLSGTANPTCQ